MNDHNDRGVSGLLASIERRDFLKTTALAGAGVALGLIGAPRAQADGEAEVWAYPDTYSILPTQTLRLHLAASAANSNAVITIYKVTQWRDSAWTLEPGDPPPITTSVTVAQSSTGPTNTATDPGIQDWNWAQTVQIGTSGAAWIDPGFYVADVRAAGSTAAPVHACWVPFVVRNPAADPVASILFKVSLNTFQAYNYGPPSAPADHQNSFYGNPKQENGKIKITFRRPFTRWTAAVSLIDYNYPLVWWLQRQGYAVDFCTDVDVHLDTNAALLSKYAVLISSGHDEYWSEAMYDHIAAYRNRGGNLIFLSGNTCCWKVEYGDPDPVLNVPRSLFCGKTPYTQDVSGPAAWWAQTPAPKDNALVGVGTRNCAVRGSGSVAPLSPPIPYSDGYRVQNADHWIFEGTGVANGKVIGFHDVVDTTDAARVENLIGPEGGGARIDYLETDGSAHLARNDGTPANFALLGVARTGSSAADLVYASACPDDPCLKWKTFSREGSLESCDPNAIYAATMGHYAAYGSVFTGSTMNWGNVLNEWDSNGGTYRSIPKHWQVAGGPAWTTDGSGKPILGNPYLHRITRNLLDAFSDRTRDVRAITGNLLVMQTKTTGEPSFWRMNGAARAASGSILYDGTSSPGKRMRLAAVASLSAGGTQLIFQDNDDGHLVYWTLSQATDGTISRQQVQPLGPGWADPPWKLRVAIDQHASSATRNLFIFQHVQTGVLYYWQMDGTNQTAGGGFNAGWGGDPLWRPVAALDLNGDGKEDLLFQHTTTRDLYYWLLDGTTVIGSGPLGTAPAANWYVVGAYDVNGAGQKDVVFQNAQTGELYYWAVTANPISAVATGPLNPGGSTSPWFL